MYTKAVRIHGKMDLRLEDVVLPEVGPLTLHRPQLQLHIFVFGEKKNNLR